MHPLDDANLPADVEDDVSFDPGEDENISFDFGRC